MGHPERRSRTGLGIAFVPLRVNRSGVYRPSSTARAVTSIVGLAANSGSALLTRPKVSGPPNDVSVASGEAACGAPEHAETE